MLSILTTLMSSDTLTVTLRQFNEFPLTRNALQVIDTRETMVAPPIAIVRRAALPLSPAATCQRRLRKRVRRCGAGGQTAPCARRG